MRQPSESLLGRHCTSRSSLGTSRPRDRFAFWTAAALAAIATTILIIQKPFFRSLISRLAGKDRPAHIVKRRTADQSLSMLAHSIMGSDTETVATVFGAPRNAVVAGEMPLAEPTKWQAVTWYYQLPRQKETAMAIRFELNLARRVDFFRARSAGFGPFPCEETA